MTVFSEQRYTWQPNDTFAAISKRYFQSEKYAAALQRFNREHPQVVQRIRDNGTPLANDTIYIPQEKILERYADVIPKDAPATTTVVPAVSVVPSPSSPPAGSSPPSSASSPPLIPTPQPESLGSPPPVR